MSDPHEHPAQELPSTSTSPQPSPPLASQASSAPDPCEADTVHHGKYARPSASLPLPNHEEKLGSYVIQRELAAGGQGRVDLARDPASGRLVAIKRPRADDPDCVIGDRFHQEARVAARLRHPNIARMHHFETNSETPFLVSEYYPAGDLKTWLNDHKGPLPFKFVAKFVAVLARAVQYMNEKGVIHRDLKPANILLEVSTKPNPSPHTAELGALTFTPCISDFGIAHLRDGSEQLTRQGDPLGTPGYQAPEQIKVGVQPITHRADVYSLGVLLHELLTRRLPIRHPSGEVLSPRRLRPDIPRDLETLCLKCLEQEPDRRLESAGFLAAELERTLRGEPTQTRPISLVERGWRFAIRRPVIALLAAALTLSVTLGGSGLLYQWRQTEKAFQQAEKARQQAERNNQQMQMLIAELLPTSPAAPAMLRTTQRLPRLEAMIQNESHLSQVMESHFRDEQTRVSLTHLRGSIGLIQTQLGNPGQAEHWFKAARDLWPAEPRTPQERKWIATTTYWQSRFHMSQGRYPQWLTLALQAQGMYFEQLEDQPRDWSLWQPLLDVSWELSHVRHPGMHTEAYLRILQHHLEPYAGRTDFRALAQRSMLSLLKGEVLFGGGAGEKARPLWQEARELSRLALKEHPDHLLASMCFLRASVRLARSEAPPQESAEALAFAARFGKHLKNLHRPHIPLAWLYHAQIECCCIQAVILFRIGKSNEAEQAIDQLDTLRATPLFISTEHVEFCTLRCLLEAIACFEKKDQPSVRRLAFHAARWAELMLDHPSRDLDYCESLVVDLMAISGYLRRLGEVRESLKLAEQSCRLCGAMYRTHPQIMNYAIRLSEAWERVAKARWDLGERASALTAFQTSLRYQRASMQRDADATNARIRESRCLDRLYHYGLLAGQHALAAQALRERAELWANESKRQQDVADDLLKLVESLEADHPDRACYTDEWMRLLQSLNQLQATSDSN